MRTKTSELRAKSKAELAADLVKCEGQLRTLRFEASFNKLKNTKALRETKKVKARILTLLRDK